MFIREKIEQVERVKLTEDVIGVYLSWMLGNSFEYDYIYATQLEDYEPPEYYKIVGLETFYKGELIDKSIIEICNGK